ncbi:MAG: type II toxin-antitoxin system PemK/MazF family toxin [Cyanobacteria bacterium J06600_6]
MSDYRLGAIWSINFEPQVASEIKKTRPGLVISNTKFNIQRQKITVLPLTSRQKQSGGMARIFVPKSTQNGLTQNSEIIAIAPATFDKKRFNRFIGILEPQLLEEVQTKLKIYLDL